MKYDGGVSVLGLPRNRAQQPIGAKLTRLDGIWPSSTAVDTDGDMARLWCGRKKLEDLWSTTAIGELQGGIISAPAKAQWGDGACFDLVKIRDGGICLRDIEAIGMGARK